jgi:hypothetical protein
MQFAFESGILCDSRLPWIVSYFGAATDHEKRPMSDRNLPFGSEFSPSTIDLAQLLEIFHSQAGNLATLKAAVRAELFESRDISEANKNTLAYNVYKSAVDYGILGTDSRLTGFGLQLYQLREDEDACFRTLAKHILLNLNGMGASALRPRHADGRP